MLLSLCAFTWTRFSSLLSFIFPSPSLKTFCDTFEFIFLGFYSSQHSHSEWKQCIWQIVPSASAEYSRRTLKKRFCLGNFRRISKIPASHNQTLEFISGIWVGKFLFLVMCEITSSERVPPRSPSSECCWNAVQNASLKIKHRACEYFNLNFSSAINLTHQLISILHASFGAYASIFAYASYATEMGNNWWIISLIDRYNRRQFLEETVGKVAIIHILELSEIDVAQNTSDMKPKHTADMNPKKKLCVHHWIKGEAHFIGKFSNTFYLTNYNFLDIIPSHFDIIECI